MLEYRLSAQLMRVRGKLDSRNIDGGEQELLAQLPMTLRRNNLLFVQQSQPA